MMVDWTIKFTIANEMHYMMIPAETSEDARAIFVEWMWGESGQCDWDSSVGKVWRALEGRGAGQETCFRNDWVAAWEVLPRRFIIR
jgi:hypothetical protein